LTALNEDILPVDTKGNVPVKVKRFHFNAAVVGDTALVFGFETEENAPGGAPQDTSAYSVRVHIASGAPKPGTAILLGIYKGTLPCADCDGLETVLRLYAKGKFDTTYAFYVRTQTYRGAPHGDVTFADRGDWTVLRGDATDENATVYQLNPDSEAKSESLLLQDNGSSLVQLDRDQKPIDTTMNMTLKRVPQSQ
jgi:copper homeostasis protein (lipoprotein)